MIEILKEYNYWGEEEIQTGYLRKIYINKFSRYLHNKLVKVILGQRRVGKSFLLRMMIKHLIENQKVPGKNILYINKDIAALDFINSSNQLIKVVNKYRQVMKPKGKVFLLFDEVQEINLILQWENTWKMRFTLT
jgi:predicted AAA+ superfamily ATPase